MKYKKYLIALSFFCVLGCSTGNSNSDNPIERGLSYVAGAILTSAVLRALFND